VAVGVVECQQHILRKFLSNTKKKKKKKKKILKTNYNLGRFWECRRIGRKGDTQVVEIEIKTHTLI
jgi:hypothetical protein